MADIGWTVRQTYESIFVYATMKALCSSFIFAYQNNLPFNNRLKVYLIYTNV